MEWGQLWLYSVKSHSRPADFRQQSRGKLQPANGHFRIIAMETVKKSPRHGLQAHREDYAGGRGVDSGPRIRFLIRRVECNIAVEGAPRVWWKACRIARRQVVNNIKMIDMVISPIPNFS